MDSAAPLDLTQCEREPIHAPGAIQPHGAFLAADAGSLLVTHASTNLSAFLGRDPAGFLGQSLDVVIGADAASTLRSGAARGLVATCPGPNGGVLRLHGFHTGGLLCIDIEPVAETSPASIDALHALTESFKSAANSVELCERAVHGLRNLTGYDRVMAYRFAEDGHGEVIAEACTPGLAPYLGLHYPASDVPPQARLLYITKAAGVIADIDARPAGILAAPDAAAGGPLDLTLSDLRAISPRHLQYMRNMGVAAAQRIGLILRQQLWGLLVCHHRTPFLPDVERRAAAALIGQIASLKLRGLAEAEMLHLRSTRKALLATLMERLVAPEPMTACLATAQTELLGLVGAGGALVNYDNATLLLGETPPLPAATQMLARLHANAKGEKLAVNGLALNHPDFAACAATASGALLLPLTPGTTDAILWFRPEQAHTVSWGGNPAEHAILDPLTGTLNPRHSFAAWKETVRGCAVPWSEADLALAREFRGAFALAVARRVQNELIRLRDYDPLTGLPKWDLLPQWISQPGRYDSDSVALLLIDLGDLKDFDGGPDQHGAGELLVELARRLMRFVGPDSLVARHGEAEFVVLYLGAGQSEVEARAAEIRHAIERPYHIQGQTCRISPAYRFAFADESASLDLAGAAGNAMEAVRQAGAFRRKVEAHRQKMEGLGRMMGGIAHEINNMLQPVTLLGQDLLDHDLVKGEARDTIGIILDCSRQARQIIGDLLAFSRPGGRSTERLDPVELLHDTLRLVRQAIPPDVRVITETQPGLPKIRVNRTTFAQVLLNLATNAAAAMEGHGPLTITLTESAGTATDIHLGKARRYIKLCVTDTGCGMDRETLERAFEPFFTTKQVGQGTGLGLSVVFSLVEEMAGNITLESAPGVGTTVTLRLPASAREG